MYLQLTDLAKHEVIPGTFAYKGEVYKITANGDVYQWDGNAQFGGFFKSVGKVLKKAGSQIVAQAKRDTKVIKKVAPYIAAAAAIYVTAGAAAGYFAAGGAAAGAAGTAAVVGGEALATTAVGSTVAATAATGWGAALSIGTSVAQSVATSVVIGAITKPKAQATPDGGIQYQDSNGKIISKAEYDALNAASASQPVPIDPNATQAAQAFYNYQAQQAQQAGSLPAGAVAYPAGYQPFTNLPPNADQGGLPVYSNQSNGFNLPTTEQAPQGIPDVTGFGGIAAMLTQYKTPIMIGIAALTLLITARSLNRGRR